MVMTRIILVPLIEGDALIRKLQCCCSLTLDVQRWELHLIVMAIKSRFEASSKERAQVYSFTTICQNSVSVSPFPPPPLLSLFSRPLSFPADRFSSTEHIRITDSTGKVSASSAVIHAHSCFEVAILFFPV